MNDRRSAWHRPTVSISASVPARVASWLGFAGLVALGLGFSAGTASAESRVALVIGNTGYHNLKALTNPANDAKDVAAALKARGFTVLEGRDLERNAMRGVVERFQAQARTADVSVVYYAGHGFQLDGQNYLVPVDATIKSRGDVETGTLNLRSITEGLEGSRGIHLVFLDACRNNPCAVRRALRMPGCRTASPAWVTLLASCSPTQHSPIMSRSTEAVAIAPSPRPSSAISRPGARTSPR